MKIQWEDQAEEQDDWRDFKEILVESARWREELNIDEPLVEDPTQAMIEDYYNRHPNAPQHDDPIHRCQAPQDIMRFDVGSRTRTYKPCWGLLR